MSRAHLAAERALCFFELAVTLILAAYTLMAFWGAFAPSRHANVTTVAQAEAPAWSAFALVIVLPPCLSFAVAGITMFKRTARRWWFQLLPVAALAAAVFFLVGL